MFDCLQHIEPSHLQQDKPPENLSDKAVDRFSQKCMFESYTIDTPENVIPSTSIYWSYHSSEGNLSN
jgi:hypothetical protein